MNLCVHINRNFKRKKRRVYRTFACHHIYELNRQFELLKRRKKRTLICIEYSNNERHKKREIEIWERIFIEEKKKTVLIMWQIPYQTSYSHRRKHKPSQYSLYITDQLSNDKKRFFALTHQRWKSKERNNQNNFQQQSHYHRYRCCFKRQFSIPVYIGDESFKLISKKLINFSNCILFGRDKRQSNSIYISIPDIGNLSKLISIVWRRQIVFFALGNKTRRKRCQFEQTNSFKVWKFTRPGDNANKKIHGPNLNR